ncbi:MAG: ATP-binding protein, partial [Candidatus Moraniibacteriota bacterium]
FLKDRFSLAAQRAIIQQIMENEKLAHQKKAEIIICDRSIVDSFVYMHSTGHKNEVDILYQEMSHWVPSYDKIVLFNPHEIPYVQDSVRTESPKKRIELHNAYLEFFEDRKINYALLTGSLEKRLRELAKILNLTI